MFPLFHQIARLFLCAGLNVVSLAALLWYHGTRRAVNVPSIPIELYFFVI